MNTLEDALRAVEANAPEQWKVTARAALEALAASGKAFTTDEVWALIPQPPEPRALGALVRSASRTGLIRRVGWRESARPECHCRPVAVWRG